MKDLKRFIAGLNHIFIKILLFLFYFLVIGLASIMYKVFSRQKTSPKSFWQNIDSKKIDMNYFSSPY